ncbi:G-protein alpha subunit [Cristinia sonorae]|uniref:G-protein alpha subunit n=1 Tax=Cristinia sonorae TaxID=1940300 RepID=A0A8K0XNL0_9AGAR|nr:G-protein alpha subunit [Cristinia sonorae]
MVQENRSQRTHISRSRHCNPAHRSRVCPPDSFYRKAPGRLANGAFTVFHFSFQNRRSRKFDTTSTSCPPFLLLHLPSMFSGRRRTVSLNRQTTPPPQWPPPPPKGESEEELTKRHEREKEARKVSHAIERQLEKDREDSAKRKANTRILILGQSESGKSTILKQFQRFYAPRAFSVEMEAWRVVIHLNLVRSVTFILDLLTNSQAGSGSSKENTSTSPTSSRIINSWISGIPMTPGAAALPGLSAKELRMRLSPLRQVEVILARRLLQNSSPSLAEMRAPSRTSVTSSSHESSFSGSGSSIFGNGRAFEVVVRGGTGWKSLVRRGMQRQSRDWQKDDLDDARQILHACREDIKALWESQDVQEGLKNENVFLQSQSGFFLDDAVRIASTNYEPTFCDILRARLQTTGVEEHRVVVEAGDHSFVNEVGSTWLFYDVGGSRSQRAAWAPFFDDVNAIIFLCPMSGFNEFLVEDRSMNRLLDSFTLWKQICSSPVLFGVTFILLLNKSDILQAKLEAGQEFSKWVKSYKDGPNDVKHVSDYLRSKFIAIHKAVPSSGKKRPLYVHTTCAIDVEAMTKVIVKVREVIIETNIVESSLL